jgi:hypothetical protein
MDWFGKPNPAGRLLRGIRWRLKMTRAMAWADVLHWHWGDTTWRGMDLRLAAWLRKPRLVEFWGDDLRDPETASRDNPFIARMYKQNPALAGCRSKPAQRLFQRHGFECLLPGVELCDYLEAGVFAGYYQTRQRLPLENFTPRFPNPHKPRPLLVHAPSAKSKKGTEAVLSALDKLAKTHPFDFKLLHQMPRSQALQTVAGCDVFLDQFTIGAEGLAALEAMALGKPVVCFIKPWRKQWRTCWLTASGGMNSECAAADTSRNTMMRGTLPPSSLTSTRSCNPGRGLPLGRRSLATAIGVRCQGLRGRANNVRHCRIAHAGRGCLLAHGAHDSLAAAPRAGR